MKDEKNTAIYVAYDETRPYDGVTPEKNLLLAILVNALSDLKKPGDAGRRAMEYFLSAEEDYVFSFQSICDYLSIDPRRVLTVTGLTRRTDPGSEARAAAPEQAKTVA